MSTRALRKLQVQVEQKVTDDLASSGDRCSNEFDEHSPKNRFAFLVNSSEEAEDNPEDHENAGEKPRETVKKRRKKKKASGNHPEVDKISGRKNVDLNLDLNLVLDEAIKRDSSHGDDAKGFVLAESDLFKIEYRSLNIENELKRLFGKAMGSLMSEDMGDNRRTIRRLDQKSSRQRRHGTSGGRIVQPRSVADRNIAKTGLSMVLEKRTPDTGVNHFKFEHNNAYQEAQFLFWDAVDKTNPELFVTILKEYPFHVDTLIQMSEIYRVNEDFGTARDLLERAIATCESAFHPMFNVAMCKSRLDYRQQENRPFFLALLKHMQYTCQRNCFRTALELCKLIYSLDPEEDPLGMLLYLDYLCLRSKQYDFLINVCHILELKAALIKFPTMLPVMLDKCSVEPDQSVSNCETFSSQEQLKDGQGLKTLLHLYVGRCSSLWKDANVVAWLERNVRKLVEDKYLEESSQDFADYRTNRRMRYQITPLNVCRHVILSTDDEARMARSYLPIDIRERSVDSHNPLPPEDSRCSYDRPGRSVQGSQMTSVGGSFLGTFLRSLMPNYNPISVADVERLADGAGGSAPDFHQSVRNVLRAVRELLAEVQPEPAPRQDDGDREEGFGDDPNDWVDNFD